MTLADPLTQDPTEQAQPTLDELIAAETQRREEEARIRETQVREAEHRAITDLMEDFDRWTSPALRAALTPAYHAHHGSPYVAWSDGAVKYEARKRGGWDSTTWVIFHNDIHCDQVDELALNRTILDRLAADRQTPPTGPLPSDGGRARELQATVLSDAPGKSRIYLLNAGSGCGQLNQLEATLVRFDASGQIELARWDSDVHYEGEAHSPIQALDQRLAGTLVPLYTAWMAEVGVAKSSTAPEADEPPF